MKLFKSLTRHFKSQNIVYAPINKSYSIKNINKNNTIHKIETNLNSKFLRDDENISSLLQEMEGTTSDFYSFKQKDEVLLIQTGSKDIKGIAQGDFIQINNKYHAQCISIKENLLSFILLEKYK
jgi:hypothetical protein